MIKYLSLLFLATSALAADNSMDLSRNDHMLHATMAYSLTVTGGKLAPKVGLHPVVVPILVFFASYIKECQDSEFSVGDLKASTLGVIGGTIFTFAF